LLARYGSDARATGKFDDSLGDDPVGEIVFKAKGNAGQFKRVTQNSLGFGIDIEDRRRQLFPWVADSFL
jgi:hypothetical protein